MNTEDDAHVTSQTPPSIAGPNETDSDAGVELVVELGVELAVEIAAEFGPDSEVAPEQPGELSEAQLEALLFVAERPLSRAEIALLARVDRETVDARVGDLVVSLAERGIRVVE